MAFGEISNTISTTIKQIVLEVFGFPQPILTTLGVAQVVLGLLLAIGLRQEFLGYRLVIGGALTLVFVYVIAPLLLGLI